MADPPPAEASTERPNEKDEKPRDRDSEDRRRRDRDGERSSRRDRDSDRDRRDRRRSRSRDRDSRSRRRSDSRSPTPERRRRKKPSNFSSTPPEGMAALLAAQQMQAMMGMQAGGAAAMPGMPGAMGLPGMPGLSMGLSGAGGGGGGGLPGMPNPAAMLQMMGQGGMPGMPGGLPNQTDATTKTMRELFVGNTPEGTQESVLMEFLNAALIKVNLTTGPGNPIVQCRVSNKFAFIELRSIEETNACLNITGIPFSGSMLKVGRPSKYTGPHVQATTWQQLTGAVSASDANAIDPSTKVYRELFIGNTSPEMNEVELQDFLGAAMQQVGLTMKPGNPILTTRLSGKFAFVEMRSIEETNNALNMNGIPYMGMNLRVGRPSKYSGPPVPHLDWNELLAKFMAGELKPVAAAAEPTCVIKLGNMVSAGDVEDEEEHADIVEDTKEECGKFGSVLGVQIPRLGAPGTGFVFVHFANKDEAGAAASALVGRTFDGKRVESSFYDEAKFAAGDFSA